MRKLFKDFLAMLLYALIFPIVVVFILAFLIPGKLLNVEFEFGVEDD